MELQDTDILYASLLGSKIVKQIPRLTAVQNELTKHVLPSIDFLPFQNRTEVKAHDDYIVYGNDDLWKATPKTPESEQFFPLSLSIDEGKTWFLLPYEPLINVSSKNTIVRRSVAKAQLNGTVKERWARDDYEITITGALFGEYEIGDYGRCYPRKDFEKLKKFLTAATVVAVKCELLQLLGINNIVIESFDFPFTKGENVQAYEIKAYSDESIKLILDVKD